METNFTKALFPAGITLTNRTRVSQFGEVGILFLINIASVVGNTLLCISFFKNGHLRSVTNVFVLTLAVSDIVMSFTAMPLSEGALVAGEWIFGSTLCHIQGFLVHFLAFVSLQVMALTAINRYYRVTKPDLYKKIFTPGYTGIMIAAVSLFSFIILATITFGQHSNMFVFHPGKAICVSLYRSIRSSRIYTIFSCIAFVFLPAFIITYCYLKVFVAIRKHFRRLSVRSISSASFSSFNSAEIIVTRTVCVIVIA
ncbi:melanopsin-B-like [Acropora palmata]